MKRVLIVAPVRQEHMIFYKYLKALNQLDTEGIKVDFFFILHNSPRLKRFLKPNQYIEYESKNEYVRDENTHHWKPNNLIDVIEMKNFLIRHTLLNKYDYMFLVDSDIILKQDTLKRLISHQKDIVAQCFWTAWKPNTEEMPNAWMLDNYNFWFDDQWKDWKNEGLFEVGMSGACILINSKVLMAGVNYTPIPNISFSLWEDRAFCIRAHVHGFQIWLDTTNCPIHLYRSEKEIKPKHNKKKQTHQTK